MDAIYYTSGTLMTILALTFTVGMIAALIKPHLINDRKVIKKPLSRPKILAVGVLAIFVTLFGFGTVLAATEPSSVKDARAAQEAAKVQPQQAPQTTSVTKTEVVKEVIPFEVKEETSSTLAQGQTQVTTSGVNGERTTTYTVTYVDGKETARVQKESVVSLEPVTQITTKGTYIAPAAPKQASPSTSGASCNPNYSGCVPNVSYDLDCKDIGYKVQVLGRDQYRLDGDKDGWGCESY